MKMFTPHLLLSLRSRLVSARHSDGTEHEHTALTEDEVNLSISNIAAQLLSDPPPIFLSLGYFESTVFGSKELSEQAAS